MNKIVKENIASILNNDPDGERVILNLASRINQDRLLRYHIETDGGEDTGPDFKNKVDAIAAIESMWGGPNSPWDLQYSA